ncbi:hypothetical protein GCM10015534_18310 [Streptomyces diastaticus subsp. diastaticus]|nr:hypothetical protein GCM10015534_18310 [Streptomyces diastaticus subsp. diastaticus]
MPIITRAMTRTGDHQARPVNARLPMGPPISSEPAAATSSSRVGCTVSRCGALARVVSGLGMGAILPHGPRNAGRAAAPVGATTPGFT